MADISISRSFFQTTAIDDSFLDIPVEKRPECKSHNIAVGLINKLVCVNDCAEQRVTLIQNFNSTITKDEEQKQYLMQVVEKQ